MLGVQASSVPRASLFLSLLIFCSTQQQAGAVNSQSLALPLGQSSTTGGADNIGGYLHTVWLSWTVGTLVLALLLLACVKANRRSSITSKIALEACVSQSSNGQVDVSPSGVVEWQGFAGIARSGSIDVFTLEERGTERRSSQTSCTSEGPLKSRDWYSHLPSAQERMSSMTLTKSTPLATTQPRMDACSDAHTLQVPGSHNVQVWPKKFDTGDVMPTSVHNALFKDLSTDSAAARPTRTRVQFFDDSVGGFVELANSTGELDTFSCGLDDRISVKDNDGQYSWRPSTLIQSCALSSSDDRGWSQEKIRAVATRQRSYGMSKSQKASQSKIVSVLWKPEHVETPVMKAAANLPSSVI